jgi:hypothetical protein
VGLLVCSGCVSSSCSTSDTRRVTVEWHEHNLIWKTCWTVLQLQVLYISMLVHFDVWSLLIIGSLTLIRISNNNKNALLYYRGIVGHLISKYVLEQLLIHQIFEMSLIFYGGICRSMCHYSTLVSMICESLCLKVISAIALFL